MMGQASIDPSRERGGLAAIMRFVPTDDVDRHASTPWWFHGNAGAVIE